MEPMPYQQDISTVSQTCQNIANVLSKNLFGLAASTEDIMYFITNKYPKGLPSCGITSRTITETQGFHALQAYCDKWGMTLSLVELYDCAACVDGADETDIHGAHQESQKQHHVQITWGTQFRPGFRIEIEAQTSGFPLLDEDQIVVQSAIGYLTTLLQRCPLTPEVCDLLHQVQTALTHLAECTPEIAIECTLTLRRRSPDYASRCSRGIRVDPEEFSMFAHGDVEGNYTCVFLPEEMEIVLTSNGQHSYCGGDPVEWLWAVTDLLTAPHAAFETGEMLTTTLELRVENTYEETATTIVLFPPPDPH